jgi:hypothetical protein
MLPLPPGPTYRDIVIRSLHRGDFTRIADSLEEFRFSRSFVAYRELWDVFDMMEKEGAYGPYEVLYKEIFVFLLELHPPLVLGLPGGTTMRQDLALFIFLSPDPLLDPDISLLALRACVESLFTNYAGIGRIVTAIGQPSPREPKVRLLLDTGFQLVEETPEGLSIFVCSPETFIPPPPPDPDDPKASPLPPNPQDPDDPRTSPSPPDPLPL